MTASFFRQGILRRSWELLWSNKILWFFGLFAAIFAVGEEYDLLVRNSDVLNAVPTQLDSLRTLQQNGSFTGLWHDILTTLRTYPLQSAAHILTWTLIILAILWIIIVSQAALIVGVQRREQGKSLGLLEGLDQGMANFWPMFLLNLTAKLFVYGLLYIVVAPLALVYLAHPSDTLILAIMFWTFIVFIPVITIVAFIMKFAASYVVIKKYPIRQAISAGWALFVRNWLVTIEMAIIMILINLGVTLVATYTLFGMFGFPYMSNVQYLMTYIAFAFIFSWLTVFQYAAWTNLFFRLEEGVAPSKLRRIIHYVLGIENKPAKSTTTRLQR